jgi:hypothetical protein
MKRMRAWMWSASAVALIPVLATAGVGPTRVRQNGASSTSPIRSIEFGSPARVSPLPVAYEAPSSGATSEIISRAGQILGVIDSPQRRNELAEQWLQYSKQVIAKDQEFRDNWLDVQRQQLAQDQEAAQLRLEVTQLQVRVEELHAENLRLEQENLQAQLKLSQGTSAQVPPALQAPSPR